MLSLKLQETKRIAEITVVVLNIILNITTALMLNTKYTTFLCAQEHMAIHQC